MKKSKTPSRITPIPKKQGLLHGILNWKVLCLAGVLGIITYTVLNNLKDNLMIAWDNYGYVYKNDLVIHQDDQTFFKILTTPQVLGTRSPIPMLRHAYNYRKHGLVRADSVIPPQPGYGTLVDLYQEPVYQAGPYNTDSVHQHILAVIFLFFFLLLLERTSSIWEAFLMALCFGIHPISVEAVAWIAAGKDRFDVLFSLLSLISYLLFRQASNSGTRTVSLAGVFVFLICALLSKATAVSVVIIFILLDKYYFNRVTLKNLLAQWHILLLLIIAIISGIDAFVQQKQGGAYVDMYPFLERIPFSFYAIQKYVFLELFPFLANLSALHEFPEIDSLWVFISIPVVGILLWVLWKFRNTTYAFYGLFFIAGIFFTLPFFGIGEAVTSERYAYFAFIGLYAIQVKGAKHYFLRLIERNKSVGLFLAILVSVGYFGFLGYTSHERVKVWHDNKTFWHDIARKNPKNQKPYHEIARSWTYEFPRNLDSAKYYLKIGIDKEPTSESYSMLGNIYAYQGSVSLAKEYYTKALILEPNNFDCLKFRGIMYLSQDSFPQAERDFDRAMQIDSTSGEIPFKQGLVHIGMKEFDLAKKDFKRTIFLNYKLPESYLNLGKLQQMTGDIPGAIESYTQSLSFNATQGNIYYQRSLLYIEIGKIDEAFQDATQAKSLGAAVSDNYLQHLTSILKSKN